MTRPTPTQPGTGDDEALADAAEEPTDEFIDVFNTETNDEAAVASDAEAQEEQTQGSAEAAPDVEPMDIFAEDGAESTAEDAVSTQKQTTAAEPAKKEQPEASEEDRRKRDEEAKRRAEAKRQADAAKKEEEARKAAEKEKAAQQTLVIGGGTTGNNGGNGVPSFNGTWKGKLGGQTCVFKVSDQSGVSMRASLKCISASSGQNYAMDVKGRHNSSKKSIYFKRSLALVGGLERTSTVTACGATGHHTPGRSSKSFRLLGNDRFWVGLWSGIWRRCHSLGCICRGIAILRPCGLFLTATPFPISSPSSRIPARRFPTFWNRERFLTFRFPFRFHFRKCPVPSSQHGWYRKRYKQRFGFFAQWSKFSVRHYRFSRVDAQRRTVLVSV